MAGGGSLTRRPWPLLLLLFFSASARPEPLHLDMEVRLDPLRREFSARALLTGLPPGAIVGLDPTLHIRRVRVDGRVVPATVLRRQGERIQPPPGRRVELDYEGRLAPTPQADHRQVLGRLPPHAGPEGSFLPAGTLWYPDPGRPFTYRLQLHLPPGQRGLVPGNLQREKADARGYQAEFLFPHPAAGIDLMAGPYVVSERLLTLPDWRRVRIRTWFHPELEALAAGYLEDSARYIERYSRLIGSYPFNDFGVVTSVLPTGFGMPGLTYLGREVLRLPFIRATSLGHEVLHNWWGNGVSPDWSRGNWSEGLTTFLADYAYKEETSAEAAREMRLAWLRDLAAVPEGQDEALRAFTTRRHGIASVVGYNKAAMLFLMLRDEIGQEAFERGLRRFWQQHRFRTAGWEELERAFAEAAGRDLAAFFRQWVERPGAPRLRITEAVAAGGRLTITLEQTGEPYALNVPVGLRIHPDRLETRRVWLDGPRLTLSLPVQGLVQAVELDPDFRLWRRLDPAQLPPILREVFIAPRAALLLPDGGADWQAAGQELAARLLDHPPDMAVGPVPEGLPLLILGSPAGVGGLLKRLGLPPVPATLAGRGSAQVWAGRDTDGRPYAVVRADTPQALALLGRALPHHGRQSWLVFDGARTLDRGIWPARPERVPVHIMQP